MDKFNQQFATQKLRQEISTTSAGATFTPGTGEQTAPRATKKVVKKKIKKEGTNIPKDFTDAPSIANRPSKAFVYKQLYEELSKALKEAKSRIHIGTDTKTDSNIYFEPQTGAFYINIIDPAGNRINKLQVNTIEDVLAKFPNWKWTEAGKAEFSGDLDEADATIKKEEVSVGDFNHYRSALNDAYFELTRQGDIKGRNAVANADKSLDNANTAEKVINNSKITPGNKATYLKAIAGIKRYLSQPNKKNESLNKSIKEEYTETNLLNILDDIRSHIETSSALDIGFKEFALPLLGSIDYNVKIEDWIEALSDLEDLNDSIKQVNRMEWEEVYNEMFEKAIRRVEPLAIEMEDEDDFYDSGEFDDGPVTDYGKYRQDADYYEKDYQKKGTGDYFQRPGGLDESYSKFKNETKTRGKSDQFHQAVKEVKKKVLEINKMYEYVSRLKEELSEGGSALEYKMHTEKALHKIKEMVSELNKKIKRFK